MRVALLNCGLSCHAGRGSKIGSVARSGVSANRAASWRFGPRDNSAELSRLVPDSRFEPSQRGRTFVSADQAFTADLIDAASGPAWRVAPRVTAPAILIVGQMLAPFFVSASWRYLFWEDSPATKTAKKDPAIHSSGFSPARPSHSISRFQNAVMRAQSLQNRFGFLAGVQIDHDEKRKHRDAHQLQHLRKVIIVRKLPQRAMELNVGLVKIFHIAFLQQRAHSLEQFSGVSNVELFRVHSAAELPSTDLLKLHVTDDFEAKVKEPAPGPGRD